MGIRLPIHPTESGQAAARGLRPIDTFRLQSLQPGIAEALLQQQRRVISGFSTAEGDHVHGAGLESYAVDSGMSVGQRDS